MKRRVSIFLAIAGLIGACDSPNGADPDEGSRAAARTVATVVSKDFDGGPPEVDDAGDAGGDPGRTSTRFAVIGDYGLAGPSEERVAALVKSWYPDFIITTGDNNYPSGAEATIDANIGQYFHEFIAPYRGGYGPGGTQNRFFPSLGNHDWYTAGAKPYLDYFTLPGNERYYDVLWESVHLFAIDSDPNEPDGITADSVQGRWLKERLLASRARWQVVYMHHPPYSSATVHGSSVVMQWPYREWGADIVFAGHDHTYERFDIDGMPYIVVGLGGHTLYQFVPPLPGSQIQYSASYGAGMVEADPERFRFRFFNVDGDVIDELHLGTP